VNSRLASVVAWGIMLDQIGPYYFLRAFFDDLLDDLPLDFFFPPPEVPLFTLLPLRPSLLSFPASISCS